MDARRKANKVKEDLGLRQWPGSAATLARVLHGRANMRATHALLFSPQSASLRESLASGSLSDDAFDRLLPFSARARSKQYWTPLSVARQAAALFQRYGAERVQDVGCGPGKFCVAAAVAQPSINFFGAEQRPHLVAVADHLAGQFEVQNTRFWCGDAFSRSWDCFDGLFFFNPFAENTLRHEDKFDQSVELSGARYRRERRSISVALQSLPLGAVLISYHGIGMPIPSSYELVGNEPAGSDRLKVWQRKRNFDESWFHVETAQGSKRVTARQLRAENGHWKRRVEE